MIKTSTKITLTSKASQRALSSKLRQPVKVRKVKATQRPMMMTMMKKKKRRRIAMIQRRKRLRYHRETLLVSAETVSKI